MAVRVKLGLMWARYTEDRRRELNCFCLPLRASDTFRENMNLGSIWIFLDEKCEFPPVTQSPDFPVYESGCR